MDSNYRDYDHMASAKRIEGYLTDSTAKYEETDKLPDRDQLTFSNGFYANCSAVFVDIRDSSKLPDSYKRPRLARIYRAYLSELVAIFNSLEKTREVNIAGDAVWAVVNTPLKDDIDDVLSAMARANSMMKVLNYKMREAAYNTPIRAGIGASWGRALMIKAGYNGSGINDVVYMGDVVNEAAKLAAYGNTTSGMWSHIPPIVVSSDFHSNLREEYQKFFKKDYTRGCYTAELVNIAMDEWYEQNCK